MTKVILDDSYNGDEIYYLYLTDDQVRLLKWLENKDFLDDVKRIDYISDDGIVFEKI